MGLRVRCRLRHRSHQRLCAQALRRRDLQSLPGRGSRGAGRGHELQARLYDQDRPVVRRIRWRRRGGQTIAWAISGRDVCRNNPDPDCLAARAVGPLPPGEYVFALRQSAADQLGAEDQAQRRRRLLEASCGTRSASPRSKSPAMLARRNIAIHVRLKGEMSEACIGLEPKGWALCRGADQGRARERAQRLHRRATSASRRRAAAGRGLGLLADELVQVGPSEHRIAPAMRREVRRLFWPSCRTSLRALAAPSSHSDLRFRKASIRSSASFPASVSRLN